MKRTKNESVASLARPLVRRLSPYVPGEQPKIPGLIKLNTNENPYPPAPEVLSATRAAVDGRLRLYPNPTAENLRKKLAKFHGCLPENIIVGNGSDELLAMAVRCFVEPAQGLSSRRAAAKSVVQYFEPSYSLYPVLAEIHGSARNAVPLGKDFSVPGIDDLEKGGQWKWDAALTFVTTPNAPSGRGYRTAYLEAVCRRQNGIVVLDEAYVDFADENALGLALKFPHVLVARTFSKAYSLCFQRIGYFVGHKGIVQALHKIRDSYNVNGLGQVAAEATLDALPYYQANFRRIRSARDRLARELAALGFDVVPSQANFILVRPPGPPARKWLDELRGRKILVRWFDQDSVRDYLRITLATAAENEKLVRAAETILREC